MRYYVTRVDWRQSRMPAGPPSGGSGGLGKRAAAEARAGTRMAGRCCAGTPGTGYAGLLRRIAVSTGARYWRPAHPSTGGPRTRPPAARISLRHGYSYRNGANCLLHQGSPEPAYLQSSLCGTTLSLEYTRSSRHVSGALMHSRT